MSHNAQKATKTMQPKYKKVKIPMPHCPKCEEQLQGNNSLALPWNCQCGTWRCSDFTASIDYEIIPNNPTT